MRGFELQNARAQRRKEIIREYHAGGPFQPCFDLDHLKGQVDAGRMAGVSPFVLRLIVRGLASFGLQQGDIAHVLSEKVENVDRYITHAVLMDSSIGASIDAQVAKEIPETDEEGRKVPVTAPLYSGDLTAAARIRALTMGQ